jgi:hypothetical protein
MDPITMALLGGTSLVSGGLGYLGSQQAGRAQQQAAQTSGLFGLIAQQQAQQQAREMAERGAAAAGEYYGKGRADLLEQARQGEAAGREFYGQGIGFQEPYMTAGAGATNQLAALFGQGGAYTQQPTFEELQMDPGYAFRMQQGQRAMESTLGSSGMRGSGAALKAGQRFGQDMASQEYQSAYNRFMANRAAATQGLQNLAGTGAGAAGTATGLAGQVGTNLMSQRFGAGTNLGSMASNAGATTAGAYTGAIPTMAALTSANPYGTAMENVGQARASSYMGGAGALGQALNTIPQNYMTYSILNRMQPQTAAATQAASAAPMQLPGAMNPFGLY